MENPGEEASSSWDARCKSPEMQLCVTCSRKSQEAGVAGAGGWEGSVVSGGERGERAGGPSAVTQPLALILSVRGSHRRTEDSAVWQDRRGRGGARTGSWKVCPCACACACGPWELLLSEGVALSRFASPRPSPAPVSPTRPAARQGRDRRSGPCCVLSARHRVWHTASARCLSAYISDSFTPAPN